MRSEQTRGGEPGCQHRELGDGEEARRDDNHDERARFGCAIPAKARTEFSRRPRFLTNGAPPPRRPAVRSSAGRTSHAPKRVRRS